MILSFRITLCCIFVFGLFSSNVMATSVTQHAAQNQTPLLVTYPNVTASTDPAYAKRTDYFVHVLRLALTKANVKFKLIPIDSQPVSAGRNARQLQRDRYNVCWMHTSIEREQELLPVRFPLLKGLMGWRIAFIRKADSAKFARITQLSELQLLEAGQGHDWLDTQILKANGLKVATSVSRNNLLAMLDHKRIDYFPRSASEIWNEWDMNQYADLTVDSSFAFWYPNSAYFYLTKRNAALAETIKKGLEVALADGSFDRLFNEYFAIAIANSKLHSRKLFVLKNPYMPPQTPLHRKEFWLMPDSINIESLITAVNP